MEEKKYDEILNEVVLFSDKNGLGNIPFKKVLPNYFKSKGYDLETQYKFYNYQNSLFRKIEISIDKDLKYIKGLEYIPYEEFESTMFLLYGWDYIVFYYFKQLKHGFKYKETKKYKELFKERLLELKSLVIDNNRNEITRTKKVPEKSISKFEINKQNIELLIDRYSFLIELEITEISINKKIPILVEIFKHENQYDSVYSKKITAGHEQFEDYGISKSYAKKIYHANNISTRRTASKSTENINTYLEAIKLLEAYPEAKNQAQKELIKIKEPI